RSIALVLVFIALVVLTSYAGTRIGQHGPLSPVAFIIAYAIASVVLMPVSVLTLAGGAMFGIVWGTIYALIGATIGATFGFCVARYGARGLVERRLANNPRFHAIDRAVGTKGVTIVMLLRLSPVFPFSFLSYALGLTRVRLADYLLGMIGIIPWTLL